MDFDQLETFLEVARHASFSRAAEKRFRTQPAISSQIRGIEEEVGAKLFDRSGGKVSLTAAGKAFLKYVEDTLDARKAMLVAIAEMERVPRGEIIVGANEGTCLHILPYVFADFKKQYPDVSVNIKRSDYAKILESIIDNSVDFGVVSLPVTDNRLTVVLIHRDELIIIAPPQHPLGKMKSATIADASKFPLIVPKAGHTRDAIEQLFHERRLKPNFTMELDSSELLKRFVAADVGIGFIARSNVEEDVRAKVLVAIPDGRRPGAPRSGAGVPQRQSSQPGRPGFHRHCGEAQIHARIGADPKSMTKLSSRLLLCCFWLCRAVPAKHGAAPASQKAARANARLGAPVDCRQSRWKQALLRGSSRRRHRPADRHHGHRRRFQESRTPPGRHWRLHRHRLHVLVFLRRNQARTARH